MESDGLRDGVVVSRWVTALGCMAGYRVRCVSIGSVPATAAKARSSARGNSFPRRSALRRIPAHALGESQYFCGALSSKICDKKDSSASLSHSCEAAVQHSPRNVTRPDVDHRLDDSSKVSASVAAEGSWNVFPDGEVWLSVGFSKFANNAS
jgi:hypothetical protein